MSRIVAVDTETTGLDFMTEDVWEIGVVDVDTGHEARWTIEPEPFRVKQMHPKAAEVNRYHERTEDPLWEWDAWVTGPDWDLRWRGIDRVLDELHGWLDGVHIVGAVPSFDTNFLAELYRTNGRDRPRWHYHLIDVEVLAVGWLWQRVRVENEDPWVVHTLPKLLTPPYDSDQLATVCGVMVPTEWRHSALGDARWAANWYRLVTGHDQIDFPEPDFA